MERRQGIFWILTIPANEYAAPTTLPTYAAYITGQLERGTAGSVLGPNQFGGRPIADTSTDGFLHWQVMVAFKSKASLRVVKSHFGQQCHAELTRSGRARSYCQKERTRVSDSFEFGALPFSVANKTDWDSVWTCAKAGDLEKIPARVRVVSYRTLRAIASDFDHPEAMERTAMVFYGPTGTGKSRRAWDEAGLQAYCKDPRSKFWCGYQGESNVIFDEFRGGIDISHILRWLDRYPVRVEVKGSSVPLRATKYWFTSNQHPDIWYPELDDLTKDALLRRLEIINLV